VDDLSLRVPKVLIKPRNEKLLRSTLENIDSIEFNISDIKSVIRDIEMIKALIKTVLAVTDDK